MTINWRADLTLVDTALTTASPIDKQIGLRLRNRLVRLGGLYDAVFPPAPAPAMPTLQVESAAHIAWATATADAIRDLDELAAHVDGGALVSVGADLEAELTAVLARLEAAKMGATAVQLALIEDALAAELPAEPLFFIDAYYVGHLAIGGPAVDFTFSGTNGSTEAAMIDLLAQVPEWLAVA